jgi:hypothetical protein
MKFKVGDKIRVVNQYAHLRLVGEVYKITEINVFEDMTSYHYIRIKDVPESNHFDNEGGMNECNIVRFFVLDGEDEEML